MVADGKDETGDIDKWTWNFTENVKLEEENGTLWAWTEEIPRRNIETTMGGRNTGLFQMIRVRFRHNFEKKLLTHARQHDE